jgi:hypothetical protein
LNCWRAGNQTYFATVIGYAYFNSDVTSLITAFVFNLMGNVLTMKNIFDKIVENLNTGAYYDIALQYGRLVRVIFTFKPIESSTIDEIKRGGFNITTVISVMQRIKN